MDYNINKTKTEFINIYLFVRDVLKDIGGMELHNFVLLAQQIFQVVLIAKYPDISGMIHSTRNFKTIHHFLNVMNALTIYSGALVKEYAQNVNQMNIRIKIKIVYLATMRHQEFQIVHSAIQLLIRLLGQKNYNVRAAL